MPKEFVSAFLADDIDALGGTLRDRIHTRRLSSQRLGQWSRSVLGA